MKQRDATSVAMQNAHQLGIIMRVTRRVINCRRLENIATVIEEAANQFKLSGCFRAVCGGEQVSCQFGAGIKRYHCVGLSCVENCETKLTSSEEYTIFKTNHVLLVILSKGLSETELDLLKDNLCILIDTLVFWLENREKILKAEQHTRDEKLAVADRMQDIMSTMLRFSRHLIESHQNLCQNLLSDLMIKLPGLGLEVDQEDSMINVVSRANTEHGNLIDLQINHNKEMQTIMSEAIYLLVDDVDSNQDDNDNVIDDAREIILF